MSRMLSYWRTLKLNSNEPQTPPLLVKYEFGPSHYKIYLSDLTYLWMESLERRQIVKRALNEDTSIDPSESGDQLQLLLQNIQKALDEVEGATLSLSKSDISQQIILHTTTPLPGALKPLVWPFHLMSAPQHLLTAELLQPCLTQQFFAKAQVVSLIQLIKDKDHVISRLTEKMQSDGTDLSKIFPGASGLRSGAKSHFRESASKFVKGLGEFDDRQWRKCFLDSTQLPSNLSDFFSQVLCSDLEDFPELVIKDTGSFWWQNLRNKDSKQSNALDTSDIKTLQQNELSAPSRDLKNGGANDAGSQPRFSAYVSKRAQNRRSPPYTYSADAPSDNIIQAESNHGDTTTDDSDGDFISGVLTDNAHKKTVQPSPDTLSRSSSAEEAEFGMFKGENSMNRKPKPDIAMGDSQKPKQASLEKTNEAMGTFRVTSPKSDNIDDVSVPQSKPRLGKIGGKSKPIKSSDPIEHRDLPFEPKSIPSRERRKLTALDAGDKTCLSLSSDTNPSKKERASLLHELPSPQRETSQERADHRREQLKRNLETAAATPTKKKRKF